MPAEADCRELVSNLDIKNPNGRRTWSTCRRSSWSRILAKEQRIVEIMGEIKGLLAEKR